MNDGQGLRAAGALRRRPGVVAGMLALTLAWLLAAALLPHPAAARPVLVVLNGGRADGSGPFLDDLAVLWARLTRPTPHRLAVRRVMGAEGRLRALVRGRGHFALIDSSRGAQLLGEHKSVAAIGLLWPSFLHVVTQAKQVSAFALPLSQEIVILENARYVYDGLLEWSQENPEAAPWFSLAPRGSSPLDIAAGGTALVLFSAPAPLAGLVQALAVEPALKVLPVSSGLLEELRLMHPWLQTRTLPRGTYRGVRRPWPLPVRHLLLVGRRDLPADVVKKMLATLYGRSAALAPFNPLFGSMRRRSNAFLAELVPYHPTAVRVLRLGKGR